MLLSSRRTFLVLPVLVFSLTSFIIGTETPEDVKKRKAWLVKKHIKRLKKVDGAIKLVGGKGEHEGEYAKNPFLLGKFLSSFI